MSDEYDIEIYRTEDGQEPLTEWLEGLRDRESKRTILLRIQRIRQGNFGDCKPVHDGVHELRIQLGPGYRIYFAHVGKKLVLLLGGGSKRGQDRDIKTCKIYLDKYKKEAKDG